MGSLGLLVFAVIIWQFLPAHSPWVVLSAATVAWSVISVFVWQIRKRARIVRGHVTSRADRA
jgi:hypothetical protein